MENVKTLQNVYNLFSHCGRYGIKKTSRMTRTSVNQLKETNLLKKLYNSKYYGLLKRHRKNEPPKKWLKFIDPQICSCL